MTSNTQLTVNGNGKTEVKFGKGLRKEFLFDERYLNLNHGSFGTYPRAVQTAMRTLQDASEARPDDFILYQFPKLLDAARAELAQFLKCPVETIVFVPNASTGVNVVLRNLVFAPGDKILYTSTIYGACHKSIEYITEITPAEAVCVEYTLPVEDEWLVDAFRSKILEEREKGNKVRIAVFDTVVSMPGVRLPFEKLTVLCKELGILSLIDAAHGVGHVELDLGTLDPDFLVSNLHKWFFTPRGSAVFYVPVRNQDSMRSTLPTSHGYVPLPQLHPYYKPSANHPLPLIGEKSAWVRANEFVGTVDGSPYLCVPAAISYRESLGGEKAILDYCHQLARQAGQLSAKLFGTEVLENSTGTSGVCCMSNVRLPLSYEAVKDIALKAGIQEEGLAFAVKIWMQRVLVEEFHTFVPVFWYNGGWWVRWSAQVYLGVEDFEWAAERVREVCGRVLKGEFVEGVESKL